jgi:hypothetical protein
MINQNFFEENQRFGTWSVLIAVVLLPFLFRLYSQIRDGEPLFSSDNIPLFVGLLITTAIVIFFLVLQLHTRIDNKGIEVRFAPVHKQWARYEWHMLQAVYVREYSPLGEYGGWGFRGTDSNKALNVSGSHGIQLIFLDGRRLLIGTQKAEEVKRVLQKINQYKLPE